MRSAERFHAARRAPTLSFEDLGRMKVMVDQIPRRAVSMRLRRPLRRRKLYRVLIAFAADFADEKVGITFEKPDHRVRSRVYGASYRKVSAVSADADWRGISTPMRLRLYPTRADPHIYRTPCAQRTTATKR